MKYYLKTSYNLGIDYKELKVSESLRSLKRIALTLEKTNARWVIVDESDNPLYWCKYIEANLQSPKNAMIATDDPYMRKLAEKKGFSVMDCQEMLRQIMKDPSPKIDLRDIEWSPEEAKKAANFMQDLVKEGIVNIIPSTMDDAKIGKELFGEKEDL